MSKQPDILSRLDRRDGMTVPDGYFADFNRRMSRSLPERPELSADAQVKIPRSMWQRVRPYVYMAAMFAGVWCMLKMFALMSDSTHTSLDTNPIMAEAMGNDAFVNEYIIDDLSQWDLYDDMMDEGIDPAVLADSMIFADEDFIPQLDSL